MELAAELYKITENFPSEEKFGNTSQMRRASVAIPSLIAEGAGRTTNKDFSKFLSMALGSCYELETQLLLSLKLNFITKNNCDQIINDCINVSKMLVNLKKSLNT